MDSEQKNDYYSKRVKIFRILKYVTLIVLILFTVITSIAGRSKLSINSLDSFFNYLRINPRLVNAEYKGIYYSPSLDSKFGIYENQFVVLSNGVLNIYSLSGIRLASFDNGSDRLSKNGKYLCSYNTNDGNIHLYNYYSEIYSLNAGNTLSSVVTGKKGGFITLHTSGSEMNGEVFSKDFKSVLSTEKTSDTIYSCALNESEDRAVFLIQEQGESFRNSHIVVYNISDKKIIFEEKNEGEVSIQTGYLSNTLYSVTDKYIRLYDSSNKETAKIEIEGNLFRVFSDDSFVVFVTYNNGVSTLTLLTKEGKSKLIVNCEGKTLQCIFSEDKMFVLTTKGLYSSINGVVTLNDYEGVMDMVMLNSGKIILCYDDHTGLLETEKEAEQ